MKTGLFFGTFDPIHLGHMQVASNLISYNIVDEVWFVVTPMNPFKKNQKISSQDHRINMVNLAINNYRHLWASDIEFNLPNPQYTANTLRNITKKYVDRNFLIAMGSDTYNNISEWQDYEYILENFKICVYEREGSPLVLDKKIIKIPGKPINISASGIRKNQTFLSSDFLHKDVLTYIKNQDLYN